MRIIIAVDADAVLDAAAVRVVDAANVKFWETFVPPFLFNKNLIPKNAFIGLVFQNKHP